MKGVCIAIALAASACERRDPPQVPAERQLRINAPPQGVRALPPHAIRADGVGPYRLGVPLEQLGTQVPSGAQNAQVDIPRVVHLNVLHAEDDAILVGGTAPVGRASFVSIVRGDIARTASGIRVGSTRAELIRALGDPAPELERARDARIIVPAQMRELRAFLADGERVAGIVVAAAEPLAKSASSCTRPDVETADAVAVRATNVGGSDARQPSDATAKIGACLTGSPDVLVVQGGDLSVQLLDSNRVIAIARIPNLLWAAPVRNPDGRDDVIAIRREDDDQTRAWLIYAYRIEGGSRVVRLVDGMAVYQLTATNARWLGSELTDLDLALEITSRSDGFEVGGLLIARRNDTLRDLVMLSPVGVPLRRARSGAGEGSDSGVSGAHTTGAQTHPKVIGK